jgi:hypothetical protein
MLRALAGAEHSVATRKNKPWQEIKGMKKVLAVLAVLAVAAAAQADLLASWGVGGVANGEDIDGFKYQDNLLLGVKDISAISGGITTGDNYDVRVNGNSGISFEYNALEDLENVKASGTYHVTAAGPAKADWYVGQTLVDSITTSVTTYNPFTSNLGNISEGSGTIKLQADLTAGRATGTRTDVSGNIDLQNLELNGTAAVPEPATMSLLGLGALAMALRRKLRK